MQKLFSKSTDEYLFEVYSADSLAIPENLGSRFFRLALLVDGTRFSNELFFGFAEDCLRKGLCYLVCWGPDCERVHDLFDEQMVDETGGDRFPVFPGSAKDVVMTTWHSNEFLEDALSFFVNSAVPTESYLQGWRHRIVIAIGNEGWGNASAAFMERVPHRLA